MLKKFFKFGPQKEDVIKVWTKVQGLASVIPVENSSSYIPDWWKQTEMWEYANQAHDHLPSGKQNPGTIKRCPAIPEYMGMGFIVPLWCDLKIEFSPGEWRWICPSGEFDFVQHGLVQLGKYFPKNARPRLILKPNPCPWHVETPPGIALLQLPLWWHFNPIFTVPPGVIWTEFYHEINQQIFIHETEESEIMIQRGTPLAQYIPIRIEEFDLEVTEETEELEMKRMIASQHQKTKFTSGYSLNRKKRKACIGK